MTPIGKVALIPPVNTVKRKIIRILKSCREKQYSYKKRGCLTFLNLKTKNEQKTKNKSLTPIRIFGLPTTRSLL